MSLLKRRKRDKTMIKYRAHIETEFGGTGYTKADTLDIARIKAVQDKYIKGIKGQKIAIVRRWITDTKNNLIEELQA